MWQDVFKVIITNMVFACRYVDNRLLCIPNYMDRQTHWKILTDSFFYDSPFELEKEPGMTFLGFDINVEDGSVQYVYPSKTWHFRSPKSAGKTLILLSGLVSRIHLIARHSYPQELIVPTVKHLISLYINLGFNQKDIFKCTKRCLTQYSISRSEVLPL